MLFWIPTSWNRMGVPRGDIGETITITITNDVKHWGAEARIEGGGKVGMKLVLN